jgi:hypothetical protein
MARVSLARQQLADTGLTAAYSPTVAAGHAVGNNGRIILRGGGVIIVPRFARV